MHGVRVMKVDQDEKRCTPVQQPSLPPCAELSRHCDKRIVVQWSGFGGLCSVLSLPTTSLSLRPVILCRLVHLL